MSDHKLSKQDKHFGEVNQDALRKYIDNLTDNENTKLISQDDIVIDKLKVLIDRHSKLRRELYLSLKKAGFTEKQSIELIK